jgi:hypothetical protein
MPFLVWPFADYFTDNTWKTFVRQRDPVSALPCEVREFQVSDTDGIWSGFQPLSTATDDWPTLSVLKESQFRLSSNFNSRSCKAAFDPILRFDPLYSLMGKKPVVFRDCKGPRFKESEYVATGKTRVQRRWDFKKRKYITEVVPILVRKIQLIPGRKIGSLRTNAFFFEEHLRTCSSPVVYFMYPTYTPVGGVPTFSDYEPHWIYQGPWVSAVSGPYASLLGSMGNEFLGACVASDQPLETFSEEIALLEAKVIRKLYSKITNQKVDLATALAEGAKSIEMFRNIFQRLLDFFLAIAKLRSGSIKSSLSKSIKDLLPFTPKKAANDFLAYRYGIKPLVSDIAGAAEALAAYFDDMPPVFARSRSRTVIDNSNFSGEVMENGFTRYRYLDKVTIDVVFRVSFKIPDLGRKRLDELGFTNPANVEWELVPFSFVLDWFLPIGNFIRDVYACNRLVVSECTRTTTIRNEQGCVYVHAGGAFLPEVDRMEPTNWDWQTNDFFCIREIIPVPNLPLPSFKNPFSAGHIANGIALLVQLISGR